MRRQVCAVKLPPEKRPAFGKTAITSPPHASEDIYMLDARELRHAPAACHADCMVLDALSFLDAIAGSRGPSRSTTMWGDGFSGQDAAGRLVTSSNGRLSALYASRLIAPETSATREPFRAESLPPTACSSCAISRASLLGFETLGSACSTKRIAARHSFRLGKIARLRRQTQSQLRKRGYRRCRPTDFLLADRQTLRWHFQSISMTRNVLHSNRGRGHLPAQYRGTSGSESGSPDASVDCNRLSWARPGPSPDANIRKFAKSLLTP